MRRREALSGRFEELGTVIRYGRPLPLCVQAADELARDHGHGFDVIDLRSIFPYDWHLISQLSLIHI